MSVAIGSLCVTWNTPQRYNKMTEKVHFFGKMFAGFKKKLYFCKRLTKKE